MDTVWGFPAKTTIYVQGGLYCIVLYILFLKLDTYMPGGQCNVSSGGRGGAHGLVNKTSEEMASKPSQLRTQSL